MKVTFKLIFLDNESEKLLFIRQSKLKVLLQQYIFIIIWDLHQQKRGLHIEASFSNIAFHNDPYLN